MNGGADFDPTGIYRYSLWRSWNQEAKRLALIMLNPSTADAAINDATIRRCIGFADSWGYGSLEVVNLFAFRTPKPRMLREAADPVGDLCNQAILRAVKRSDQIVIAWGNWGNLHQRDQAVLKLLADQEIYCFGYNQSGQPCHPLYLKSSSRPILWRSAA